MMSVHSFTFLLFFFRVYLVYRHSKLSRETQEIMDFPPPNVEYPLQESPDMQQSHKDLSDSAEGQADGGYGSGDTPTTISPAESSDYIIGRSDCMVPSQTESSLPDGGARHVLSASLPIAPNQLHLEDVLQQYQSRTLDNKDSEDMDNKVNNFASEDNNRERDNSIFHNNNY